MRYEDSRSGEKSKLERILAKVNLGLAVVIALCFNYIYIDFLFR